MKIPKRGGGSGKNSQKCRFLAVQPVAVTSLYLPLLMRDKGCKCRRTSNLDPSSFVFVQSGQVKGRKLEIHRSPPSQHHAHTRKSNWSPPQLLPPNTRDGRSCTATHETQLRALKLYPARDGSGCGRRGGRQVCWMQVWGGTNLIPASEHEISPRRLVQLKLIRLKCT